MRFSTLGVSFISFGWSGRNRTFKWMSNSHLLYRLSHTPVESFSCRELARQDGKPKRRDYLLFGCGNGFCGLYILTVAAASRVAPWLNHEAFRTFFLPAITVSG